MKKTGSPHSFNGTRNVVLLAGLLAVGTAHSALVGPGSGGPAGTLTDEGGTASLMSPNGSQSSSLAAGQASADAGGSQSQGSPGSFVEQASGHATLVNTTGKTASFGVNLSGSSSYGPDVSGLQFAATASFGSQHDDVSDVRQGYAIDGVVLKPGESALVGLDYEIVASNPSSAVGNPAVRQNTTLVLNPSTTTDSFSPTPPGWRTY